MQLDGIDLINTEEREAFPSAGLHDILEA